MKKFNLKIASLATFYHKIKNNLEKINNIINNIF